MNRHGLDAVAVNSTTSTATYELVCRLEKQTKLVNSYIRQSYSS